MCSRIEVAVRNHLTAPISREVEGWCRWNVLPAVLRHEQIAMNILAVGLVIFCLALAGIS